MICNAKVIDELNSLVPGLEIGMDVDEALSLIISEIRRLREIEFKFEGLCK